MELNPHDGEKKNWDEESETLFINTSTDLANQILSLKREFDCVRMDSKEITLCWKIDAVGKLYCYYDIKPNKYGGLVISLCTSSKELLELKKHIFQEVYYLNFEDGLKGMKTYLNRLRSILEQINSGATYIKKGT